MGSSEYVGWSSWLFIISRPFAGKFFIIIILARREQGFFSRFDRWGRTQYGSHDRIASSDRYSYFTK